VLTGHDPCIHGNIRKNSPLAVLHTDIIGDLIGHCPGVIDDFVIIPAGDDACAATDATVQIYHQA
jgi:hypothetical protein